MTVKDSDSDKRCSASRTCDLSIWIVGWVFYPAADLTDRADQLLSSNRPVLRREKIIADDSD